MSNPPPRRITGYQPIKGPNNQNPQPSKSVLVESKGPAKISTIDIEESSNKTVTIQQPIIKPSLPIAKSNNNGDNDKLQSQPEKIIQQQQPQKPQQQQNKKQYKQRQQQPNKELKTQNGPKKKKYKQKLTDQKFPPKQNLIHDNKQGSKKQNADEDSNEDNESSNEESSDEKNLGNKFHESSTEEEDFYIDFESAAHRPNDGASIKSFFVGEEMGLDEERLLKKLIKRYAEKRKNFKVQCIEQLKISHDVFYPKIRLFYRLNKKEQDMNILHMYKGLHQKDSSLRTLLRKLYTNNFVTLPRDACKKLFPVALYRLKYTQKEFIGQLDEKERSGLSKTLAAVYAFIPNLTVQFVFVDINYNQVSFNNMFIEKYQDRFPESYKYYSKAFKPRLILDQKGALINQEDMVRPHLADQEISSDDESKRRTARPINIKSMKEQMLNLFSEQLTFYAEKIDEKQEQFERIHNSETDRNQDKQAIIAGQVGQMQQNMDSYKMSREGLRVEYEVLLSSRSQLSEIEKDSKLYLIYKQLRMLRNQLESQLPIIAKKRQLFKYLNKSDLIILQGETGSGKSTQLPQMLCEYYKIFSNDKIKPIVLTQPRKIATRTLAQRIAYEMGEEVHGFVDYVASSGTKINKNSKIIVKLDRLLLDEIQADPLLENYSCLVIDEAHQRTISIDVIIGLVTQILKQRKDFKVIITSATLDAALFEKYFRANTDKYFTVKTFKVSGRLYPVDIIHKPYPEIETTEDKVYKCITEEILQNKSSLKGKYKGHVLTFCSGVDEINRLCDRMRNLLNMTNFVVIGLHGKLTTEQQRLAFSETPGQSKIIFSTRIAQTAITIDKVKVVIDPGHDRENVYDQKKKISSFQLMPISLSAAKQRAGRAGRTSEGYCFRLYDQTFEKEGMPANKTPEIESIPLDILVLRLKSLKIADILTFRYLSKPKEENIKASMETMQLIGCLDDQMQITQIGKAIVRIPIEPFLSRAIIDALIVEKLDPTRRVTEKIIKILAIIVNSQSVFYSPENMREICEKSKFEEFAEKQGDFFSLLNVYETFDRVSKQSKQRLGGFIRERFLSKKSLFQSRDLIREIMTITNGIQISLKELGGYVDEVRHKIQLFPQTNQLILSCLLTSFCQNLCLYSGDSQIGYTLISSKQPVQIYGSSFLALQGINPKWIVCYDIIKTSNTFCRVAQEVTFDLLRASVSKQVFQKYRLTECEKFNPFYKSIQRQQPSVIIRHIQTKKYEGDKNLPWLSNINIIFDRETNRLKVYALQDQAHHLQQLQDYIKQYNSDLLEKRVVHSYLGNITAVMGAGCSVKQLHLECNFYSVKINQIDKQYQGIVYYFYNQFCYSIEMNTKDMVITFTSEDDRKVFMQWWSKEFLNQNKELSRCRLQLVKNYVERKNRVSTACLKLRFWASETKSQSTLCIVYFDPRPDLIEKNHHDLATTCKELALHIPSIQFHVSKKGNSISAHIQKHRQIIRDQFELDRQLNKMYQTNKIVLMHRYVIGFRDIDTQKSIISQQKWIQQIQRLFDEEEVPTQHIKIHGVCKDNGCKLARLRKNSYGNHKDCNEHMTDITATINIYNSKTAEEFIQKYDGKHNILGTQKLHATLEYKLTILRLPSRIYQIFRDKYLNKKDYLQAEFPGMELTQRFWVNNKGKYNNKKQKEQFVFIECCSHKRDQLIAPTVAIREIFTKYIIKLEPQLVRAINRYEFYDGRNQRMYDILFDNIELNFYLDIRLEYTTMKNQLKVYCQKEIFPMVENALTTAFSHLDKYSIKLSYRGKNIYKVQEIMQKFQGRVHASISFSEKCVNAHGKAEQITEFKNQIDKLVDNGKAQCQICFNILNMPMRLLICNHTFCNNCVVNYLRSIKQQSSNFPLMCPNDNCNTAISIHDLRMLLQYEDFNQTCDRGIMKLVDNIKYHGCFTVNCQQIFEMERTKANGNFFHCSMCNLAYCWLCHDDRHEKMSCEAYKQSKNYKVTSDEMMKLGIKKCKKCNNGIQKNGGCNHISCTCGAHICWKCEKMFNNSVECCDHLAKECGGIFGD